MTAKQQFQAELDPLLVRIEQAILAGDGDTSQALSLEVLKLVQKYAPQLSKDEMRKALNSTTANIIAERLGVAP